MSVLKCLANYRTHWIRVIQLIYMHDDDQPLEVEEGATLIVDPCIASMHVRIICKWIHFACLNRSTYFNNWLLWNNLNAFMGSTYIKSCFLNCKCNIPNIFYLKNTSLSGTGGWTPLPPNISGLLAGQGVELPSPPILADMSFKNLRSFTCSQ